MNDCSSEGNYFAQTYQKKSSYMHAVARRWGSGPFVIASTNENERTEQVVAVHRNRH